MSKDANVSRRSRREFMKTAGIVSAGMTVGSVLSTAPAVHAAGSDVIKVGLVGCGGRGMGSLVDRLKVGDAIQIVALGDLDRTRAMRRVEELANLEEAKGKVDLTPDRIFGGFDSYKMVTDLSDTVLIASPAGFHPDHYLHAVEKGKHVFVEKPFCVDAEGYRRCMKANQLAEEKGLTVCAGFQRRHQEKYIQWISRIHAGEIGDILSTRMHWNGGSGGAGRPARADEPELRFQLRCWYVFNWLCGDHNVEQHCHNLDVGNWIHGKGDPLAHPVSCFGTGGRQVRRAPRFQPQQSGNIFDHHYVEYKYADGSFMHAMCRQQPNVFNYVCEQVSGTKGSGECRAWEPVCWVQPTGGNRWEYPRRNPPVTEYVQEHIDQTEAIRKGERLHFGWSAATSSMTAVMGRMATYSGQEIKWEDAVAKGITLFPYDQELTDDTPPPITFGPDGTYEHTVAIPGEYDPFDPT